MPWEMHESTQMKSHPDFSTWEDLLEEGLLQPLTNRQVRAEKGRLGLAKCIYKGPEARKSCGLLEGSSTRLQPETLGKSGEEWDWRSYQNPPILRGFACSFKIYRFYPPKPRKFGSSMARFYLKKDHVTFSVGNGCLGG